MIHMNKNLIVFGLVVLLLCVWLSGCTDNINGDELSIESFIAEPNSIYFSETTTISWEIQGASSVSIDNGIGNVESSGSKIITPTQTGIYTITASDSSSTINRSIEIVVIKKSINAVLYSTDSVNNTATFQVTGMDNNILWSDIDCRFLYEEWNRTYGGVSFDTGSSGVYISDNGFAITGYNRWKSWLVKTDMSGILQWEKTYGYDTSGDDEFLMEGEETSWGKSVKQTSDDGFIITGYIEPYKTERKDIILIKTISNGSQEWFKTFGWDDNDSGEAVLQTNDGGYIIAGVKDTIKENYYYPDSSSNAFLLKTDENGIEKWNRTYGGTDGDSFKDIDKTDDGGLILVGNTVSFGLNNYDIWVLKTDLSGNEKWNRTYDASNYDDYASSIQQTSDGGFIIMGNAGNMIWLIKIDEHGDKQWNFIRRGHSFSKGHSIEQTSDSGYIIGGEIYPEIGNYDGLLIKTDENGVEQWNMTLGGGEYDEIYSVLQTTDKSYILIGETRTFTQGWGDAWLIKIANNNQTETDIVSWVSGNDDYVELGDYFTVGYDGAGGFIIDLNYMDYSLWNSQRIII